MSQRWHHVRTPDGFEIHDENGLIVARVHNPTHDREADALLIADAPRLRERLNRYEPDVATVRARLIKELVSWISIGMISSSRAQRFDRGVKRLARMLGRDPESVRAELQAEAHALGSKEERS